jgi:hypothetical protein
MICHLGLPRHALIVEKSDDLDLKKKKKKKAMICQGKSQTYMVITLP